MGKLMILKVAPNTKRFYLESKVDKVFATEIEGKLLVYYHALDAILLKNRIKRIYPKAEFEKMWVYEDDLKCNTVKKIFNREDEVRLEVELTGEIEDYKKYFLFEKGTPTLTIWIKKHDFLGYISDGKTKARYQVSYDEHLCPEMDLPILTGKKVPPVTSIEIFRNKIIDALPNRDEVEGYDTEAWEKEKRVILKMKSGEEIEF